jgi:hypothetical protein
MTPAQLQEIRDAAHAWAKEHGKTDGYVTFWCGTLAGWSVSRARLEAAGYLPGVVAIPIGIGCRYAALVAVGGNYENGCDRWEELMLEQSPFDETASKCAMTEELVERLASVAEFWANKLATETAPTTRIQSERYGRSQGYRQMASLLRSEVDAQLWCENAETHGFKPCR